MSAWRTASIVSQNETLGSGASSSGRRGQVRIGDEDPLLPAARQLRGDGDRRALPHVVDIGLVGQAEAGDDRPFEAFGPLADLRDDKFGLPSLTSRAVRISRALLRRG